MFALALQQSNHPTGGREAEPRGANPCLAPVGRVVWVVFSGWPTQMFTVPQGSSVPRFKRTGRRSREAAPCPASHANPNKFSSSARCLHEQQDHPRSPGAISVCSPLPNSPCPSVAALPAAAAVQAWAAQAAGMPPSPRTPGSLPPKVGSRRVQLATLGMPGASTCTFEAPAAGRGAAGPWQDLGVAAAAVSNSEEAASHSRVLWAESIDAGLPAPRVDVISGLDRCRPGAAAGAVA